MAIVERKDDANCVRRVLGWWWKGRLLSAGRGRPGSSAGSNRAGPVANWWAWPPPPPINLLFHDFLTLPFRRVLGRVEVLNHFETALSVCCPLWA